MKNFFARTLSVFGLLMLFSLKVSVPLLAQLSRDQQELVTGQEDDSQEKSPDKSAREWESEAFFSSGIALVTVNPQKLRFFDLYGQPFLPEQFSNIPSPPPWVKS